MPNGTEYFKSTLGTILSLCTLVIMISYSSYKFAEMINKSEYRLVEENQDFFFEEIDSFGSDDGFHLAAGIMTFQNGAQGVSVDPEIGSLKMIMKEWNTFDETTKGNIEFNHLKTR